MTKSESARINGAKSHGPKTEAGRKRSSQNAIKHGLSSQMLVLPTEDPDEFQQLLTSYLDRFQPDGPAELHLVHDMVAARWRLERLAIIENQLYVEYIERAEERAEDNADHPQSPIESLTSAFTGLANSNTYPFLQRVEARLERTYSRALRSLTQLQRLRQPNNAPTPAENKICTNEPTEPIRPNGLFTLDQPSQLEKSPIRLDTGKTLTPRESGPFDTIAGAPGRATSNANVDANNDPR